MRSREPKKEKQKPKIKKSRSQELAQNTKKAKNVPPKKGPKPHADDKGKTKEKQRRYDKGEVKPSSFSSPLYLFGRCP
jgi:hypothetical protein